MLHRYENPAGKQTKRIQVQKIFERSSRNRIAPQHTAEILRVRTGEFIRTPAGFANVDDIHVNPLRRQQFSHERPVCLHYSK